MKRVLLLAVLIFLGILPAAALAGGRLPERAAQAADAMDSQLIQRLELYEKPAKDYTLVITTPVSLSDLESTSPLAQQLAEELAAWFVNAGYKVQEIRKGKNVLFARDEGGEFLLTRRVNLLGQGNVRSALVLVGTYVYTSQNVRFNLRLLHSPSNEVLAMSNFTLPMSQEVRELMPEKVAKQLTAIQPSVRTSLAPLQQ